MVSSTRSITPVSAPLTENVKQSRSGAPLHSETLYEDRIEETPAAFGPLIPYQPSKPVLPEFAIIKTLDRFYETGRKIQMRATKNLEDVQTKVDELQRQNAEKLKESAKLAQESGFWAVMQQVGACLFGALSAVLGFSLVATRVNPTVGWLLISSGILSIANLAFSATGVWDWVAKKIAHDNEDMQKNISTILPASVGLVCAGIGLAGGMGSLNGLWASLNFSQRSLVVLQTAVCFAEGISTLAGGYSEYKALVAKSELVDIEKKMNFSYQTVEKLTRGIEKTMKELKHGSDRAAEIIKLSASSNRRVTQA